MTQLQKLWEIAMAPTSEESILALGIILAYAYLDGARDGVQFKKRNAFYRAFAWAMSGINEKPGLGAMTTAFFHIFSQKAWHRIQFIQQAAIILGVAWMAHDWSVILPGAAGFWILHDGVLNVSGFKKPFFFVGTSAWFDKIFQDLGTWLWMKFDGTPDHLRKLTYTLSAVTKVTLFILGLVPFIFKLLTNG